MSGRTKNINKSNQDEMMIGKLPPQDVELESAVLGAIMLESAAIKKVSHILKPESFYKESHQFIMEACISLSNASEPIDMLTVTHKLKSMEKLSIVGGPLAISQMTNKVAGTSHIEYHARIIQQKFMQRELIRISNDVASDCYDDTADVFDIMAKAQSSISAILTSNVTRQASSVSSLVKPMLEDIESRSKIENFTSGITTGIRAVNNIITFRKGNLIYLAARPGVGKTGLMISMAIAAAREGKPVAVFSMEMTKEELMFRIVAQIASIEVEQAMNSILEQPQMIAIHENLGKIESLPIYIDDTPALSIFDLRAKATVLKEKFGIEEILADYVQLMTTGQTDKKYNGGSREQEISVISRGLKQVAKELNVPVIALSQLTREVEKRTDKRPQLSDLRDSGSLEQDADAVMFIYRPEYHHEYQDKGGNSTLGVAEIIIAKNRNGKIANRKARFIAKFAKFTDWDNESGIHPDDRIESKKQENDVF